jgi:hypothetical protein
LRCIVIARSEAMKQSIVDLAMPSDGLLRCARNDETAAAIPFAPADYAFG